MHIIAVIRNVHIKCCVLCLLWCCCSLTQASSASTVLPCSPWYQGFVFLLIWSTSAWKSVNKRYILIPPLSYESTFYVLVSIYLLSHLSCFCPADTVWGFATWSFFTRIGLSAPYPKPKSGEPVYLFSSGSSLETCLPQVALPAARLC